MLNPRALLKSYGIAPTRQRACILKSMQERSDHPDAEQVFASLRGHLPTLSLDTVYRTLRLFAREGVVTQLAVPTRRFRYDGNNHPHDHFLCIRCNAIIDIFPKDDAVDDLPDATRLIGEVHAKQLVYLGTCRNCLSQAV